MSHYSRITRSLAGLPVAAALVLATLLAPPAAAAAPAATPPAAVHDMLLRGGTIYDGSGSKPYVGDVVIDGERISYVGPANGQKARTELDVHGLAVAPGFINMLAHPEESLLVDGRALSDLIQGVTLEVMGEDSMGPLNPKMKELMIARQGDIKIPGDLDQPR